jgi:hypothetical protein
MIERDVNDEEDEQKALLRWMELKEIRRMLRAKIIDPPYIEGGTEELMRRANGNCVCACCWYSYRMHPDYMGQLAVTVSRFSTFFVMVPWCIFEYAAQVFLGIAYFCLYEFGVV